MNQNKETSMKNEEKHVSCEEASGFKKDWIIKFLMCWSYLQKELQNIKELPISV